MSKYIICGLGGQGVVFLTRLIAKTAMRNGQNVLVSETHGMSQRGGSVISHLKIGNNLAPLIQPGTADALLAMDPAEAVRNMHFLRQGGAAFINSSEKVYPELQPHLERLNIQVHYIPASQIAVELGAAAIANVVLAGFACTHPALEISPDELRQTIRSDAKGRHELNLKALDAGLNAANFTPHT